MKNEGFSLSIWERDTLLGDCELIVIGAGLTGLSTALNYAQKRNSSGRILVVDREPMIRRASTRNAGFAVFGSLSEIRDDIDQMGLDRAMELIRWRARSLLKLTSDIPSQYIDYQECGGIELFFNEQQSLLDQSRELMDDVNDALSDIFQEEVFRLASDAAQYPFQNIAGAIENSFEGLLHPAKVVRVLERRAYSMGIELRDGWTVNDVERISDRWHLTVNGAHSLTTERLMIATNGLARQFLPEYDIHPARNVILVTNSLSEKLPPRAYHCDRGYLYFRPVRGNRLLIGGGRQWTPDGDTTDSLNIDEDIQFRLLEFARNIFDDSELSTEHSWAGTLGLGDERMPLLERIDERMVACVRLGGMGVALSASVGERAANLLLKQ